MYPKCCTTEIQKAVYDELCRLSDENDDCVTIQDFEPFEEQFGYSRLQIIEVITFFDSHGLFKFAQHAGGDCPIVFSLYRR